ncbi:unnamed protein product [Ilex paraguariensis]|uniref:Uncharacterized protein n=1 Tax=Ilex paraguariensis TaxID=185542 RepID=A0ABC8S4S1_9AQUA
MVALNASEKPKPKVGQLQHPISSSNLVNPSPRGGTVKSDFSKTSNGGKLHVLKPARERNGVSSAKDRLSPTSSMKVANIPLAIAPLVCGTARLGSSGNNPALATADRKPALATLEKRPTSQAQSRNDFFNLMRKKSMTNSSSAAADPGSAVSPSALDKSGETAVPTASVAARSTDAADDPLPDGSTRNQSLENRGELTLNGAAYDGPQESIDNGKNHSTSDAILHSEEEEAAFLRSLGWEENSGEDEGLTEEEISAFYRDVNKYINTRPSSKILQGMQPRFLVPLSSQMRSVCGVSSGLSPSDSKLES